MRNIKTFIVFGLILSVVLLPLFSLPKEEEKIESAAIEVVAKKESKEENEENLLKDTVRVKMDNGKIKKMNMEDYLYGVVAAECPMLFHEEAIKAQIVAAHTFTLYRINQNKKEKFDVSTDSKTCQAYVTKSQAKENWGSEWKTYDEKLEDLINENLCYVITYEKKPIFAAYHAISAGKTENAENVWGNKCDYLKSVPSAHDKLASSYLTTATFTFKELNSKLKPYGFSGEALSKAKVTKTKAGNATKLTYSGKSITASELVSALGLRSNNFDMENKGEKITFTVRGYGHQVGMSQTGANYMAKDGMTFDEILNHYYTNIEILKVSQ